MNILTPLPVFVCNHRGVKNHHITERYMINTYKASTLSGNLPEGVTVCNKYSGIQYRCTLPIKNCGWRHNACATIHEFERFIEYSGILENNDMHKDFMETYQLIRPIINQLFDRELLAA